MTATDAPPPSFRSYLGVVTLVFVLLFGATWVWVVAAPYTYMRGNYPIWMAKLELSERPVPIVVLGDSCAVAGVVPAEVGPGVVNLALGGSSPIETFFMAKRVLSHEPSPKAAVLSFTPFQLAHSDWFWSYGVQFGLINAQDLEDVRRTGRSLHDTSLLGPPSPGDIDIRLEGFLNSIKFPPYYFASLIHSGFFLRNKANHEMLDHTRASRGQCYFGLAKKSTELDGDANVPAFVVPPILDHYFDATVSLFVAHHIPIYFIAMPHNAFSAPYCVPAYKSGYLDYLKGYETKYPDFHVLGDPFMTYPSDCFGDGHHLNEEGAHRWSPEVARLLRDAGVSVDAPANP